MKRGARRKWFFLVFLGPSLLLYTAFVFVPALSALGYSFLRWDGLTEATWVGMRNYERLFEENALFLAALRHNLVLLVFGGGATLCMALFFAAALHRKVRGSQVFRIAFFFPNVIAAVAVALLWVLLYSTTEFGVFNAILGTLQRAVVSLGLEWNGPRLPFPFLTSKYLVYALVPMMVWTATGFYMVLFLAGMQNIPESYYEAAELDGAGPVQQFFQITLPLLREVLTVGVVFMVISSLKFFDPVWVMENQRPNRDSHVLATLLYQKVFTEYNVGYGSAVAVLLFLLVFAATLLSLKLSRADRIEF